ncbi:MAG: hypothetical protein ACM3ZQ_03875 [Bacillota bacterium]
MLTPNDFFDLSSYAHRSLFAGVTYVWDALKNLNAYLEQNLVQGNQAQVHPSAVIEGPVMIGEGTIIEPGVMIKGPVIIGKHCQIRQGAYIRENCLIGDNCVVGHTSELKGTIMLDHSQAPHFAYVGDSILGNKVNLGAGSKLSNLKITHDRVRLIIDGVAYDTGLRKLGAILGDNVQLGCNCVTAPGTLVGRDTLIYSLAAPRGYYPPNSIVKLHQDLEVVPRR